MRAVLMNWGAAYVAIALLAGCATPVGQIPDDDFNWTTADLKVGYQAAYRNLRTAFPACLDQALEGEIYTDIREARIVVYFKAGWPFNTSNGMVHGVITVNEIDATSSRVKVGVQKIYDPRDRTAKRWADWASGAGCSGA